MMNIPNKVLIFAAHHDDETIGCGGTIRKWSELGSTIDVVFMTNGDTGIDQASQHDEKTIIATRQQEAAEAARILGISKICNLKIQCQRVKNTKETFHRVIKEIREAKPDLVITHHHDDKHRDHRSTSEIVREACWKANENTLKDLGAPHKVEDLWAFEILDHLPRVDFIVNTTDTHHIKMSAMKVYDSQQGVISGIYEYLMGSSMVHGYAIGKKHGEAFMRISKVPVEV